MWTHFHDMHSGGGQKLDWGHIFIEAPESEAEIIFFNRFGRNPHKVTCTCCGPDYSVSEEEGEGDEGLAQVTGYERRCYYDRANHVYIELPRDSKCKDYLDLDAYLASGAACVIRAEEIKPEERVGSLPRQGYVWVDE